MFRKLIGACVVAVLLSPMAANATIIMTITDDGTNLTMLATGTYDNTGLAAIGSTNLGVAAIVGPVQCCYGWETGGGDRFAASFSGSLTGTSDAFGGDILSTTNPFFFWHLANRVAFDVAAPLIGSVNESAIFLGITLSSLGMLPGETITVTWGNNIGIIQTSPLSIPEPTTLALFAMGLAGLGFMRRRRRR